VITICFALIAKQHPLARVDVMVNLANSHNVLFSSANFVLDKILLFIHTLPDNKVCSNTLEFIGLCLLSTFFSAPISFLLLALIKRLRAPSS
jgi:ABC-type phosphate/phosphonate transport system permease subunit